MSPARGAQPQNEHTSPGRVILSVIRPKQARHTTAPPPATPSWFELTIAPQALHVASVPLMGISASPAPDRSYIFAIPTFTHWAGDIPSMSPIGRTKSTRAVPGIDWRSSLAILSSRDVLGGQATKTINTSPFTSVGSISSSYNRSVAIYRRMPVQSIVTAAPEKSVSSVSVAVSSSGFSVRPGPTLRELTQCAADAPSAGRRPLQ